MNAGTRAGDPIELPITLGALHAACEEMGALLIRAAHSPNIKERRDASSALFNARGEMIMQAEHIPVHLGAMPAAVATVLAHDQPPGRSWILNDPFAGGTHLPDITVISAAHLDGRLIGFAATRAHHADVGGITAGSMPADSHTLAEEGVLIPPQPFAEAQIHGLVASMRQPAERAADLRAQLAANVIGARRLQELARRLGPRDLERTLASVLDYGERRARAAIAALGDGVREARDVIEAPEGDLELRLRATVCGGRIVLDFADSAGQHPGNLNAPLAVTRSACYFAIRVLTDPETPPNAGAYRPIEICAPAGSLLNARRPAAVAAGNVETSSRVADLVLGAFGRALGQGTMNNLTLGNAGFSYYETIGGGQGACSDANGPSCVHVAMSNTLNTPVEALERDIPASGPAQRAPAGLRRGGEVSRRRRHRPRTRGARADAVLADCRAPAPSSAWRGRRGGRGARPRHTRRRAARREINRDDGGRLAPANRDARRRRLRARRSAASGARRDGSRTAGRSVKVRRPPAGD